MNLWLRFVIWWNAPRYDMDFYGPLRSSQRALRRQLVQFWREHPELRGKVDSEEFDTFTEQGHGKFARKVAHYRVVVIRG